MRYTHIYWCPECNVVLLGKVCGRCGAVGRKVKTSPSGEPRIALKGDIRLLHVALTNETGIDCYEDIIGKSNLVIVNRCRYIDFMEEVIVDGVRLGKLYYDPKLRRARFRWSYVGALRAIEKGLCETLVCRNTKIREGTTIRLSRDHPLEEQIILVDKTYDPIGVGYVTKKGLRVRDVFFSRETPICAKTGDITTAIKANEEYLRRLESRSITTIWKYVTRSRKPIGIAFSGGKDSTLALHLTMEIGIEPKVIFNNTGVEFPETLNYVNEVIDRYGMELIEVSPIGDFWKLVDKLGPPSVSYRWCTKVLKLAPLNSLLKKEPMLIIDGMRKGESPRRSSLRMLRTSSTTPWVLYLSPILQWSALEEWLYIIWRRIRYNPLYDNCFNRIGCFMCPTSTLFEYEYVKKRHPSLWERWESLMGVWRERHNLPKEWEEYALWRWEGRAKALQDLCKHLGVDYRHVYLWRTSFKKLLQDIKVQGGACELIFTNALNLAKIKGISVTESWKCEKMNEDELVLLRGRAKAIIRRDGRIIINTDTMSLDVISILRITFRSILCTSCNSCYLSCPMDAIKGGSVYADRCNSCGLCIEVCPVAYGIERLLKYMVNVHKVIGIHGMMHKARVKIGEDILEPREDKGYDIVWPNSFSFMEL